jgi:enamine deaminase RidA (YjgF/YER057c/UK114 family)
MNPEDRLSAMGIELPAVPSPVGSYLPAVRTGNLLFLSGVLPFRQGKLVKTGRVGREISLEEAQEEARTSVLNALSIAKAYACNLGNIRRCVKITGYVASLADFTEQPAVLNAASDLLFAVFGDQGRHARVAVGVNVLPLNSPVEIEFVFEISEVS